MTLFGVRHHMTILMVGALLVSACTPSGASNPATAGTSVGGVIPGGSPAGDSAGGVISGGSPGTCTGTTKLQLGYDTTEQSTAPMLIAKEQGYFQKYGIDATLVLIEAPRVLTGVISKATPIAFSGGIDILRPIAQGADIVAILASGSKPTDMLVGGKGIATPQDLKGKTVGVSVSGGEADLLVRIALKSIGLNPDTDVSIVNVGDQSLRIAALQAGRVQATLVDVGLTKQMTALGFATLFDLTSGSTKFLKGVLVTTKSYASANQQTVQCVVNAIVDAIQFYKTNKAVSVDVEAKYNANADRPGLETLWDNYAPLMPDRPTVEVDSLLNIQKVINDPKVQAIDINAIIDNSFVNNVALK